MKKLREKARKKIESKKKGRKKMEPNVVEVFCFFSFFCCVFLMFIFKLLAFKKLEKTFEIIINKNTLQ